MPSISYWQGIGGGTSHYRCLTPGKALARAGWDVNLIESNDDPIGDVLVMQRLVGDWIPDAIRELKAKSDTLVVYDIDDWYAGIPDYNLASKTLTADNHAQVRALMGLADLVTVSTPELAEGYAAFGPVAVLPNYLDPDIWSDTQRWRHRLDDPRIRVGWMGAFNWRSGDVELLKPWIGQFLKQHPECVLATAGAPELFEFLDVPGITSPPLYEDAPNTLRPYEHLPSMLAAFDIGLVPLAQNRFNQAKSWTKGLEHNACGIPIVASPSREYRSYVRPGVNGLLVRKENWSQQTEAIIADFEQYQAGAVKVAGEYFIDDHIGKWVAAYDGARRDLGQRRPVSA